MPPTGNLASGVTALILKRAQECERQNALKGLRNIQCPLPRPLMGSAMYASILELDASKGCPHTPQELALFPQKATTSSINTRVIQQNAILCGTTGNNRVIVAPCPGPTAEQLNSTNPIPSRNFCYSKRIYN